MKALVALLLAFALMGCSNGAKEKLEDLGYRDVNIEGIAYFAPRAWECGESLKYHFTAKKANGEPVKGVVCYPNFLFDVAHEEKI